jgi:hypothetical protein
MNTRKILASTAAAAMVMGGIGFAYAQSDAPMNPPTAANQAPGTAGMTGANNTLSNANTPAAAPMQSQTPSYNTTTPNTQSTQATTTMPAPQADRG